MKVTILFACLLGMLHHLVDGQIVLNEQGNLFSESPDFNSSFLSKNKVNRIYGSVKVKPELRTIRNYGEKFIYNFDHNGRTIYSFQRVHLGQYKFDTLSCFYEYQYGLLKLKRCSDTEGFYSKRYKRDNKGRIIEEDYYREENAAPFFDVFHLKSEIFISSKKTEYQPYLETGQKATFYNNLDKPYKYEYTTYTSLGDLKKIEIEFFITSRKDVYTYTYDDFRRLGSVEYTSTINGGISKKWTYNYDENGNVQQEKEFKNSLLVRTQEFLYTPLMLLDARLDKNEKSKDIYIYEMDYLMGN